MRYKDYIARVEFDDEAGLFHGEVINTRDVITFQGESVAALRQAFEESVDDYLAFCAERGEKPEKPFSGKFVSRISGETHSRIFMAAKSEGKSLNAWVAEALDRAASAVELADDDKPRIASLNSLATQLEQINHHLATISVMLQQSYATPITTATASSASGAISAIFIAGSHLMTTPIIGVGKGFSQLHFREEKRVSTETSFHEKQPKDLN